MLSKYSNFKLIPQAFLLVWKSTRKWTSINLGITIAHGIIPLAILYLMKLIIDSVTAALSTPNPSDHFSEVFIYIVITAIVYIINTLTRSLLILAKSHQSQNASDFMLQKVYEKTSTLDLSFFENAAHQDTLHRASAEAGFRPSYIVESLGLVLQSAVSLAVISFLLLSLHWSVMAVLLLATLPGAIVKLRFSNVMYKWVRKSTQTERKSRYFGRLMSELEYVQENRLYNSSPNWLKRFKLLRQELLLAKLKIITRKSLSEMVALFASAIAVFISYTIIVKNALDGFITIGAVVMYFMAFQRGMVHLRDLLQSMASLYENNLFIQDLYKLLDFENKITDGQICAPTEIETLEFKNVSFRYPESEKDSLTNVSFKIQSGQKIAIVGQNGAGKTTIIKLLIRLYDPSQGEILLNGKNIKEYKISQYRNLIAVVFQDFVKYHLSVKENLLVSMQEKQNSEKINDALQKSGIHLKNDFRIDSVNSILGKQFDNGQELSKGQWQRLAIARAYYRNAPILIFDEPTSALDAIAENNLIEHIAELMNQKTAIVISHRLSMMKYTDKILVFMQGKLIEQGTHKKLTESETLYKKLFDKQAKHYQF